MGAGPGGAYTALALAKLGIKSTLVDKAIFPRDKICGDALSGKVREALNLIDPQICAEWEKTALQVPSYGISIIAPNLERLDIPFTPDYQNATHSPGYVSERMKFDNFLIEKCKSNALIEVLEGIDIVEHEKLVDGWRLADKEKKNVFECKLVIVANGAHSKFARQIGGIEVEHEHYCAGLRAYYKNVEGLHAYNFIELHFLKDFLPGYFWIFPLPNGMANVGVGMRSDKVSSKKVNLKARMLEIIHEYPYLKERFKNAELVDEIKGYGLPMGSKKRKISGLGYLLVGDAASLIDPFTGEGIGNAMISGGIAATTAAKCLEHNQFDEKATALYDKAIYDKLWPELQMSYRLQQLVNYPRLFNFIVNRANRNRKLRETLIFMFADVDLRKQFKNPFFYLRMLFPQK